MGVIALETVTYRSGIVALKLFISGSVTIIVNAKYAMFYFNTK